MNKSIITCLITVFVITNTAFSQSYYLNQYSNPDAFLQKCKCTNEKWGFSVRNGNEIIINCVYDNVEEFDCIYIDGKQDGRKKHFARVNSNGLWGIIDSQGELVVPCIYNRIEKIYIYTSLLPVEKEGKWGYLDIKNNWNKIITCQYDVAYNFSNYFDIKAGIAQVQLNGKWGYINYLGQDIIPFKYEDFKSINSNEGLMSSIISDLSKSSINFIHGFISAKFNGKWGVIDSIGNTIIPFKYDEISFNNNTDDYIIVKLNNKVGWLDRKTYKEIIPCLYDNIDYFSNNKDFIRVKLDEKYGLLDKSYKAFIPIQFADIVELGNFLEVKTISQSYSDCKRGLYDKNTGKEVLPAIYTRISFADEKNSYVRDNPNEEYNSFIRIEMKNTYGLCDINGKVILPCKFKRIESFDSKGFAKVELEDKYGVYDKSGKEIIPCKFDRIDAFDSKGYAKVQLDNQYGLYENIGKEIIACHYQSIGTFDDAGYIGVLINGVWQYVDKDGNGKKTDDNRQNTKVAFQGTKKDIVDINVPTTNIVNDKTFAVIIANERYKTETQVDYAMNDGSIFREYCVKTLGLSVQNIHFAQNATLNEIRREINWLTNINEAFGNEAKIIFYYAGHGIPDESSKTSYLLPIDGYSSDVSTGYSLDNIYSAFGKFSAKQVIVFLDACFSGSKRDGKMLTAARGVSIKAKSNTPQGNLVVFSASQGEETAYQYKEKEHGMFTYFLLKKLQETKGNVTLYDLSNYIVKNVKQTSIVENEKIQTPSISTSVQIGTDWMNLKLIEK